MYKKRTKNYIKCVIEAFSLGPLQYHTYPTGVHKVSIGTYIYIAVDDKRTLPEWSLQSLSPHRSV